MNRVTTNVLRVLQGTACPLLLPRGLPPVVFRVLVGFPFLPSSRWFVEPVAEKAYAAHSSGRLE